MIVASQLFDSNTSTLDQSLRALDAVNFFVGGALASFGPFVALFLGGQGWAPENVGGGFYYLVVKSSGMCMGIRDSSSANGAQIEQQLCSGGSQQEWNLAPVNIGSYNLISKLSRKCVDLLDFSTNDHAMIQQWDCSNNTAQEWQFR